MLPRHPAAALGALFLLISTQILTTIRRCSATSDAVSPSPTAILFLIATVYTAMTLAVVIPVCPPLGRMTDAAAVLLGAPLAAALCDRVRRLRARADN